MGQPNSISFDEVMGLLRGPIVREFEGNYVTTRGYTVAEYWGDSQKLTKQLASAQITRGAIEELLGSRADLLGKFIDRLQTLSGDEQEYAEGEEPDPDDVDEPVKSDEPISFLRGFSIHVACRVWLLTERADSELIAWLKFCRIPHHKKYAADLRRIIGECNQ